MPRDLDQITLVFDRPVTNVGGAPIDASALTITSTDNPSIPGPPIVPGVFRVDVSTNRKTVVVTLTHLIPVGEWTTLTANVEGPSGDPAAVSVRVGHLPLDVDQDGEVTISDVGTYALSGERFPSLQNSSTWTAPA